MRNFTVDQNHHLWIFDRVKHEWTNATHNKLKPNDIFIFFKKDWKTVCDTCGEYILYCKEVNLEDTNTTVYYTPLRKQLELFSQEVRNTILAEKHLAL
jgi:hypothetical protein